MWNFTQLLFAYISRYLTIATLISAWTLVYNVLQVQRKNAKRTVHPLVPPHAKRMMHTLPFNGVKMTTPLV